MECHIYAETKEIFGIKLQYVKQGGESESEGKCGLSCGQSTCFSCPMVKRCLGSPARILQSTREAATATTAPFEELLESSQTVPVPEPSHSVTSKPSVHICKICQLTMLPTR